MKVQRRHLKPQLKHQTKTLISESVLNNQKNSTFSMAFKTSTSASVYKKDDTVHCWQGWSVKRKERNLPLNFGRL